MERRDHWKARGGGAFAPEEPDGGKGIRAGPPGSERLPASAVLGEVARLMSRSEAHRHLFLAELEWLVAPPMRLRQFRIFRRDGAAVGYVSWAYLSDETVARLGSSRHPRLRPDEWNGGGNLWIIDIVAPLGGGEGMLAELKEKLFKDRPFEVLVPGLGGEIGVVAEERGTQ